LGFHERHALPEPLPPGAEQAGEDLGTTLRRLLGDLRAQVDGTSALEREEQAIRMMATVIGGAALAEAVSDPDLASEIARTCRTALDSVDAP